MSNILKHAINKLPLTRAQKKRLTYNAGNNLTKVTWKELKDLRDNSQLVPGCWYRMTDYECIVAPNTTYKSAGHQFDLIILATDVNKLSEDCKACRHEGDSYFPDDTNFEAWEVKYCIDNDNSRFDWVCKKGTYVGGHIKIELEDLGSYDQDIFVTLDSTDDTTVPGFPYRISTIMEEITVNSYLDTIEGSSYNVFLELPEGIMPPGYPNLIGPFPQPYAISTIKSEDGKGIIYGLKDERNNKCSYDFKNILFKTFKYNNIELINYFKNNPSSTIAEEIKGLSDIKIQQLVAIIGMFTINHNAIENISIDKETYLYTFSKYNGVDDSVLDISLNVAVRNNIINSKSASLKRNCFVATPITSFSYVGNIIEDGNNSVINGNLVAYTNIGFGFNNNTIIGYVDSNVINSYFENNIIVGKIRRNIIGTAFTTNFIKGIMYSNTIGNNFSNNITESYIQVSTLGNNIQHCTFKGIENSGSIQRSKIGNLLSYVVSEKCIGHDCILDNDIQDIHFYEDMTNARIQGGIYGNTTTHESPIEITINLSRKVLTKNSQGKLVAYNPADLAPESAIIQ